MHHVQRGNRKVSGRRKQRKTSSVHIAVLPRKHPLISSTYHISAPCDLADPARKHQARHEGPHKCSVDECPRAMQGFATVNDRLRHEKSVHKMNTRHTRSYRCFAPSCGKSEKDWPRLDNFKQHLTRMHPDSDMDELLRQLVSLSKTRKFS
jgi:hypothetical protein